MPREEQEPRPMEAGTVTRLAQQKRDPQRVSVFIDGVFAFGIHVDLVVDFGLYKGQALSVEAQQEILEADKGRTARQIALDYLSYKARTEQEVRRKLERSGFEEIVADHTVARLYEWGYLDDAAYAHTYVGARFRSRGYGPQRLRSDLMRRGVAPRHIDTALAGLQGEVDMLDAARRHAAKRWSRLAMETDPRRRRKKLSDFLGRRGFSFDTIRRVVDELEQQETDS